MEEIKVKYFTDDIDELCYVDGKSDWIDLHLAEEVTLKAGEFRLLPLGVAIALPEGYEAHIMELFRGKAKFLISGLEGSSAAVLGASAVGWDI